MLLPAPAGVVDNHPPPTDTRTYIYIYIYSLGGKPPKAPPPGERYMVVNITSPPPAVPTIPLVVTIYENKFICICIIYLYTYVANEQPIGPYPSPDLGPERTSGGASLLCNTNYNPYAAAPQRVRHDLVRARVISLQLAPWGRQWVQRGSSPPPPLATAV